ncbi:MAG TPA: right-handed parallel beta-helix repeat-containing protein [Phycisphaerae bacterium]
MKRELVRRILPVCLAILIVGAWFAQAGSLNPPPGPVTSTMKALDVVEPRTTVQSLPGSAGALILISQPGSYYLTGDIQGLPGKHGIQIAADNVTLDLNGFSVLGTGSGDFDGITTDQVPFVQRRNITIINGTVRNWGRDGINGVFGSSNCIYRDLRLSDNHRNGLTTVAGSIANCVAQGNTNSGFIAYEGTSLTGCSAWGNGQGFGCFFGATLANCAARTNGVGIFIGDGAVATNCIISGSTGTGLGMGNSAVALNNQIDSSGNHGIEMFFNPSGARIEGNTVTRSTGVGINLTGGTNIIVLRNTARANTGGNYVTGAGNSFGPIVNVAGVGDISATGGANHPWANFSY